MSHCRLRIMRMTSKPLIVKKAPRGQNLEDPPRGTLS